VVSEHPALRLARTAHLAAEELQGCLRPEDGVPAKLTPGDHVELLEQIRDTLNMLGKSVGNIAMSQESGRGTRIPLVKAAGALWVARDRVSQGAAAVSGSEPEGVAPTARNHAARLARTDFPHPVSSRAATADADVTRAATPARPRRPVLLPGTSRLNR
jgi:Mrp family chromosome partitioning ATPase